MYLYIGYILLYYRKVAILMDNNKTWLFDIEVFPNLFCVTFKNVGTQKVKLFSLFGNRNDINELEEFLDDEIVIVGYNNLFYDNPVMQYLLQNKKAKSILADLFEFSSDIINSDRGNFYNSSVKKYQNTKTKYTQIDMMKIIEISGVAPSLKQAGINLKSKKIQDLPLPYDHHVTQDEAETIYKYNLNDVLISEALFYEILPRIELREKLKDIFHVDLMNASDSKMADRLLEKFYVEELHADMSVVRNLRTSREQFMLRDCVAPNIKFNTNYLKRIKSEIENTLVRKSNKYKYSKHISFGGVEYDLGVGGLHSVDFPAVFVSNDEWKIFDQDVASFYPSMMILNEITPEHLGKEFVKVLERITKERLAAKKSGDKVKAEGLKVTINSIFGKLGSDTFWLEDAKALRSVTVSGQLYLLMFIEKLVLSGIQVISANTDGVVSRVHKSQLELYDKLAEEWQKETGFVLEKTEYKKYFRQDVNNYITIKYNGEIKEKGRYVQTSDVKKGYKHPVIPKAMFEYVVNDIPIENTILNHPNILDFCISQKSGKDFQMEFHLSESDVELLQKNNRFYVSVDGGRLNKRHKEKGNVIGLLVGENVTILNDYDETLPISEYNINYDWYISEAKKYVDGILEYSDTFQPFVDEEENYQVPTDTIKRENFFYKFQKVKGLPEKVIDNLMWLEDNFKGDGFCEFLVFAEENSKLSSKFETLIKLNEFSRFGNQKELLSFYKEFTSGENKYSAKLSSKTREKRLLELQNMWNWRKTEKFSFQEQIKNEASVIGEPHSIYPVHKLYVYIVDINLKSYHPKLKVHILKTGEQRELKINQDLYYQHHFQHGDILLCKTFEKKFRKTKDEETGKWIDTDKFDYYLTSYYIMKETDSFIEG